MVEFSLSGQVAMEFFQNSDHPTTPKPMRNLLTPLIKHSESIANFVIKVALVFLIIEFGRMSRAYEDDMAADEKRLEAKARSYGWIESDEYKLIKQREELLLPGIVIATALNWDEREELLTYEGIDPDGSIRLNEYLGSGANNRRYLKFNPTQTMVVHDPYDAGNQGELHIFALREKTGRLILNIERPDPHMTAIND
jgi:hypothetical protein